MTRITASEEKIKEMLQALKNFKNAAARITDLWHSVDLDDLNASSKYPFAKSFDEVYIDIGDWVVETVSDLENFIEPRIVARFPFENTGGGCEVTFFEVDNCGDVRTIGITDECIIGYPGRWSDEGTWADGNEGYRSFEELRKAFGLRIASEVAIAYDDFCKKFDVKGCVDL